MARALAIIPSISAAAPGSRADHGVAAEKVRVGERLVQAPHRQEVDVCLADPLGGSLLRGDPGLALLVRLVRGQRGAEGPQHAAQCVLDRREEQVLLRSEQAHHVRLAHPGGARHLVRGRALVSPRPEDGDRRLQDLPAALVGRQPTAGVDSVVEGRGRTAVRCRRAHAERLSANDLTL